MSKITITIEVPDGGYCNPTKDERCDLLGETRCKLFYADLTWEVSDCRIKFSKCAECKAALDKTE